MSESRSSKTLQKMENDTVAQAMRAQESSPNSPAFNMQSPSNFEQLINAFANAQSLFKVHDDTMRWAQLSSAMDAATSQLVQSETFDELQNLHAGLENLVTFEQSNAFQAANKIKAFSGLAAQLVQLDHQHFEKIGSWHASLFARMDRLDFSWAKQIHFADSMIGFARIARLHDISQSPEGFGPFGRDIFAEELGAPVLFDVDQSLKERAAAQLNAGLNPEVIAFNEDAYPQVLFTAGFEFQYEESEPVKAESGEIGSFNPQYAALLREVENRLRGFIERELYQVSGRDWLRHRVNGELRKKWQLRKEVDQVARRDSFPLLYYADFMELMHIIVAGHNWRNAFQRFFKSKEDFQVSMSRLGPIRNAIGHNRPLVLGDQLILLSESSRILRALKV